MAVHVINEHPGIDSSIEHSCVLAGEQLLRASDKDNHQFTILLTTDDAVRELNHTYRHRDKPTNVLSFAFEILEEPFQTLIGSKELGDIVISCDRAIAEAGEYNCTLLQRLIWLIVHGFLHLLGYDHEASEQEAEIMFRKEQELLSVLTADDDS